MDDSVIKIIRKTIGHITIHTIKLLRTTSIRVINLIYTLYWAIFSASIIFAIALINAIATRIVGN